jgi:hypothetical protein
MWIRNLAAKKGFIKFIVMLTTFCFRESYGNFLARLETVFGVSQQGVQIIATEMCELSNQVLSHCMKSVSDHLGKLK